MFCDSNNGLLGDDSLKGYLFDKTSRFFNRDRYHLYAHIHAGALERMNGINDLMVKQAEDIRKYTLIRGWRKISYG